MTEMKKNIYSINIFENPVMVKICVCLTCKIKYLRGFLAPYSHCSLLFETPLAGKTNQENDLSLAPEGSMNSLFDQFRLSQYLEGIIIIKIS